MSNSSSVFIIEDDQRIRIPLEHLLADAGYRVQAFSSAEDFLAKFDGARPGCILLDLRLEGQMQGLDLQRELTARGCRIPLIILSAYADLPTTVVAVKAGAVDVLEKPFNTEQLLARIDAALKSDSEALDDREKRLDGLSTLSRREREVLQRLLAARSTKEIAKDLAISPKTVEKHRSNIYIKMNVESVPQLMLLFVPIGFGVPEAASR